MGRGFQDDILTLAVLLGGGYIIYTKTDWFQQFFAAVKDIMGGVKGGGKSGGGGAAVGGGAITGGNLNAKGGETIFPSTGKKWQAKDSGKTTRNYASGKSSTGTTQWDIKGVGPVTDLEVTTYVNVGSCGDEVSLKVYGPSHSGSNCCWLIMDVSTSDGKFMLGGEGPHPKTSKNGLGTGNAMGSIKNKQVGIKLVTYKSGGGYTAIGYGDTGSGWKEMIRKTFTEFGNNKKSSTPHQDATIQFRTDCSGVKYIVAEAAEIRPTGGPAPTPTKASSKYTSYYETSPGQFTNNLFTRNRPLPVDYYNERLLPYCDQVSGGSCYDRNDSEY